MVLYSCWDLCHFIRRVISCILFSLEQSWVVDLTVAEHHPDLILEPNVLNFEFSQLLLRRISDSSRQFCHMFFFSSVHLINDKGFL